MDKNEKRGWTIFLLYLFLSLIVLALSGNRTFWLSILFAGIFARVHLWLEK